MENLISTIQLAEKLNVHKATVIRMANDKRIPVIKISETEFRFNLKEVLVALEKNSK